MYNSLSARTFLIILLLLLSAPNLDARELPLIFDADKLEYYDEKGIIEGHGNVHLRYQEMELEADYVRFNLNSKDLFARGNVIFYRDSEKVFAKEMKYNLGEELGTAKEISTFHKPWYIDSAGFEKSSPNEYLLERGVFSTCDVTPPHYRFTAKRIKLYPGDHLLAYHTVLYVRKIPLIYLPVCRRSLKDVPSGFVARPGYDSERGTFVLSHYNWYLSEKFNGRWYVDFFEKRGWGKGLDVNLGYGAKRPGWAYLYGYHIDEKESSEEGQESAEERWKLHFRHRQKISRHTTEIARIDKISDADFNKDYLDEEVLHFLSRGELENHRPEGSLSITTNKPGYSSTVYIRKRVNSFKDITESLPRVSFDLVDDVIGETSFYYDLDANFAYLHRKITVEVETEEVSNGDESSDEQTNGEETNDNETGDEETEEEEPVFITTKKKVVQLDLHPELSHQTRLGWFRAQPTVGLDGYWYSEDELGEKGRLEWGYKSSLPLTMAYGIWRIFDTPNWQVIKRVRHSILPKVTYYYRPDPGENTENIYGFCGRLGDEESRIKLELTNYVEGKGASGGRYEMLYFDLYTYHDLLEKDKPWSDIYADLKLESLKDITWRTRAGYDPYVEKFESLDTDFRVEKEDWEVWAGTRLYSPRGKKHTFDLLGKIETPLGRKWRVDLQGRYDLNESDFKVRRVTLYRDLHCWEAQLFWQNEKSGDEDETKIFFAFRIKAVPGVSLKAPIGDFFWGE